MIVAGTFVEAADAARRAPAADELVILANPGARWGGTGAIGNHYLDHARGDVVGLIHADVTLSLAAAHALANTADRLGALVGIVGKAHGEPRMSEVWGKDLNMPRAVSTLDSCAVFVPRRLGLRFDAEAFDAFHCCVEDLCLSARARGVASVVAPPGGEHAGTRHEGAAWQAEYWGYRERLARKWGSDFSTT